MILPASIQMPPNRVVKRTIKKKSVKVLPLTVERLGQYAACFA